MNTHWPAAKIPALKEHDMKTLLRRNPAAAALAGLIFLLLLGVWLIFTYVAKERGRDLQSWQTVLGIVADTRFQMVDGWLDTQQSTLRELSENTSLQLYLTQVTVSSPGDEMAAAQAGYLRNLIIATAERTGFSNPETQSPIRANLSPRQGNALALLDLQGRVVTATSGFALNAALAAAATEASRQGSPQVRHLSLASGEPAVAFLVPVPAIQGPGGTKPGMGVLVGIKQARPELYPLLTRKISTYGSEESLLVSRDGESVFYLSPLADGSAPLSKKLAFSTPSLAEAYALTSPGEFTADKRDYRGTQVLLTSRSFRQVPWVLVEKIDAGEALQESSTHRQFLLTSFLLTMSLVAAALIAAWWYGSSAKERKTAEQLRAKSRELEKQSGLLRAISNSTPDMILIADENQHFVFANQALGEATNLKPEDFPGKTLSSVFGAQAAHGFEQLLTKTLKTDQTTSVLQSMEIGNRRGIFHTTAAPLKLGHGSAHSVLCVARDMTETQRTQEKHDELMKNLVCTLMRTVDQHDPYCAGHSERTAQVAVAIGRELNLDNDALEQLELAASLANVGKLLIPKEILTKTEPLSEQEMNTLKQHVQHARDILGGLDFEGPVLEIILQKHEHMDGSGYPRGLRGDQMLLEGRILAVANTFVAMVSARAYRLGLPVEEVLNNLLAPSNANLYDRHVVAALFHVAENRPEWISWREPELKPKWIIEK